MNAITATIAPFSAEFVALAHSDEPIRESYFAPVWEQCWKCEGTGSVSWGMNVDGLVGNRLVPFVCFSCNGVGGKTISAKTQVSRCRTERKNHQEAIRVREQAEKSQSERDAKLAAWIKDHKDVMEALNTLQGLFPDNLRDSLSEYGSLTENQCTAILNAATEKAQAVEVPEGRGTVTGKIVSVKRTENFYGYSATVNYRATIVDDRGFRVNGNLPSSLINDLYAMWEQEHTTGHSDRAHWEDIAKGVRVTFTATLEPKETGFAFFKRPTKASIR